MRPWWYVHAELQHDGVSVVRTLPAAPPSLPAPKLPPRVGYSQDKACCSQDSLLELKRWPVFSPRSPRTGESPTGQSAVDNHLT